MIPRLQDHMAPKSETQTPFQLNEYTIADVAPVPPPNNGKLLTLNLNYNVSNVDQVYLPLALEPIRPGFDVGYVGSTISVTDFRDKLVSFTGANANQTDATNWPIYNNPIVGGKRRYPNAGIRVPSTLASFNFYAKSVLY